METEFTTEKELLPYPFGSPRDILTAIFRQKIKILIVFIILLSSVVWWVYSTQVLYDAHATIILKIGRESIYRPEIGDVNQIVRFNESAAVESERKILESRDLARRVVEKIGVENFYPELLGPSGEVRQGHIETATSIFLGNLETVSPKGTNVIEIIFMHQDRNMAAKGLNVLVEVLKDKHLQVFSDPKAAFLVQRLDQYRKDLEGTEKILQDFKKKHDLSSPLEDQQRRLLDQRALLDSNYKTIKNQLQGLEGKIASLDGHMKTILDNIPVSTVEEGGNLEKAKTDLFVLKRQEHELLTKYTETSFPVQNLRKEISQLEQFILAEQKNERNNTIASGKKAMYSQLEKERLGAISESTTLQASGHVMALQIKDLGNKIQRLDQLGEELVGLERKHSTAEENYKLYIKKVEEAKVSEEMDQLKMSNISVIQSADVPRMPFGRSVNLKLLLGLIFASIGSVGLGFVFEYLQGGYTRPDQAAEDLDLPVLASFTQKS